MKINWRVRLKNKVWLTTALATVVAFIYDLLTMLDIVPPVEQNLVMGVITAVLSMLTALGVVIDPTTAGASDSDRAMTYE